VGFDFRHQYARIRRTRPLEIVPAYLKAGTALDFGGGGRCGRDVDDTSVGGTPDATHDLHAAVGNVKGPVIGSNGGGDTATLSMVENDRGDDGGRDRRRHDACHGRGRPWTALFQINPTTGV
jgi:hypothetical protein